MVPEKYSQREMFAHNVGCCRKIILRISYATTSSVLFLIRYFRDLKVVIIIICFPDQNGLCYRIMIIRLYYQTSSY